MSGGDGPLLLPDAATEDSVVLWGSLVLQSEPPRWAETRIPARLCYPVAGRPTHVRATVMVYTCGGRPLYTRLKAIKGEDREPIPLW